MRVLIRADASSTIGIGHLMRSLALAQALHDGGDAVTLVTAEDLGPLASLWEQEGTIVRRIDAEIGSTEDARQTIGIARDIRAAWVALDGYAFVTSYRFALDCDARLLLVDDHGAAGLHGDLVVNGNLYGSDAMYPAVDGRLLAGPRYAMLRREFRVPAGAEDGDRTGILLSLGGADPQQLTAPLLEALAARGMRGRVVIGPRFPSPDTLRSLAIDLEWEPVVAPADMAALFRSAEMVIVGSGTTTLECAALGIPMVAIRIAANQVPVAAALEELGLAVVADGDDIEGAAESAAALAADPKRRALMAESGPRLVDGHGAVRVARAMREILLTVRPATRDDARLLFDWRNDSGTRAASFATPPVPWDGHVAWLDRVLVSPDMRLVVAELEGQPVGVVRLERRGETATISITVAPEARSQGLAAPVIGAGMEAASELNVGRVVAWIRPENIASRRAFAAAGFAEAARTAGDQGPADAVLMVASLG